MNILMLLQANFPIDLRVRQEAITLIKEGHNVSVIALKYKGQSYFETIEGVNVYRIPNIELFRTVKQKSSQHLRVVYFLKLLIGYGFEHLYFTLACFLLSFFVVIKNNVDVIHAHNPPDTLFLVGIIFKIFGKRFIYEHHDLSPELFLEKSPYGSKIVYRILRLLEKMSCQTADLVITTNESYKKIEIERSGAFPQSVFVVRYGPNLNEIKKAEPIQSIRKMGKTVLCYLGEINIQDGVDGLLIIMANIVYQLHNKDVILLIIGDGDYLPTIRQLAKDLDIGQYLFFTGYITDRGKLNRYMSTADMFVDAASNSFLNNNSTFIKHMEYMIFGKPIVSFLLKESMVSLKDAGVFIPPNDTEKMAKRIIELINNKKEMKLFGLNASRRAKELTWDKVSKPLIDAYHTLAQHL